MSLPIRYNGVKSLVSIYGVGSSSGISGIAPANSDFKFGMIDYTEVQSYAIGDSVMFRRSEVIGEFTYSGQVYTLIEEDKIITVETPPEAEP